MIYFMGIDIGSTTSKGVITSAGKLLADHVLISGINYRETAEKLRRELLAKAGLSPKDIAYSVATGQGAAIVTFCDQKIADIRCCGRGINSVFPSARTVIDVQAQYSQVLRLNERGQVTNFSASEKCAAGSGRFMEVIANVLQVDLNEIGPLSLKSENPITFTTSCAVFGESEAISRVAEGIPKEDILAGVHKALAEKISALIGRVGLELDCAISGGGGLDIGLVKSLEEKLEIKLLVPPKPRIINALGATILAEDIKQRGAAVESIKPERTNLTRESLGGEL
ncbi:acyl-CoA dehydratase activase [Chloroflexota bacterium]